MVGRTKDQEEKSSLPRTSQKTEKILGDPFVPRQGSFAEISDPAMTSKASTEPPWMEHWQGRREEPRGESRLLPTVLGLKNHKGKSHLSAP